MDNERGRAVLIGEDGLRTTPLLAELCALAFGGESGETGGESGETGGESGETGGKDVMYTKITITTRVEKLK